MSIITIDCGASFIKGALLNNDTGIILNTLIEKAPEIINPFPNKNENKIVDDIVKIVANIIKKLAINDSVHLYISNQMHGFVLVKDGILVTDYVSWQVELALEKENDVSFLDKMKKIVTKEAVLNSGMPLKSGLPSSTIYTMKEKGFFEKEKRYTLYTLGDYIAYRLTGKRPKMHITNAAATGLFNIVTRNWNEELINQLELNFLDLLPLSNDRKNNDDISFKEGLSVFPALGDQQAALLGADFTKESNLSINLGTGSQVSILHQSLVLSNDFQTRPYFNDYYLLTIPHIPSGRALNVFFGLFNDAIQELMPNTYQESDIWKYIIEKASNSKLTDMKIDMSFFSNPLTDRQVGAVTNIKEHEFSVGTLFKAIFNQYAYNIVLMSNRLIKGNNQIDKIIFTGGIAYKNNIIRNLILEKMPYQIEHQLVDGDTFKGLWKYAKIIDNN